MEDFVTALNKIHDKLCKNIVHREPSYILLPEEEYPVSVVEFEEMFELMVEVPREEIREDKIYGMIQDVISCMRDTGMMDSYLYLSFERGTESYIIGDTFSIGVIRGIIEEDVYETRDDKLFFFEDRVDTITTMMSIRDPKHLEEDNKRYGDMNDMLMRMMLSLKSLKNIFDKKHEKEKENNEIDKKARDLKSTGQESGEDEVDTSDMSEGESSEEETQDLILEFSKKARIPSMVM